ncbi:hypothetical protein F2P56_015090 [Juglans regia]|uniref:Uncharacterized protein LOC109008410 n=2 Tax=Juglans regia TaxID=51240 RepID=A0A2I4GJG4_JUGRE|nr:uncharacterized protein LOC109008410 [Juglans regia]KAF5465059.1 hypothetical protein F2P56_015090 [Juglans regia]
METRPDRPFSYWEGRSQISHGGSGLLHEMGRGGGFSFHHSSSNHKDKSQVLISGTPSSQQAGGSNQQGPPEYPKERLVAQKDSWADELLRVLWAHKTSVKTATGEIPFALVYGAKAVVPVKVGMATSQIQHFRLDLQ